MKGTFVIGGDFDFTTPDETRSIVQDILRVNNSRDTRRGVWRPLSQSVSIPVSTGDGAADLVYNFGQPPPGKMWYAISAVPIVLDETVFRTFYSIANTRLGIDEDAIAAVVTVGPLRITGLYIGRDINVTDIVDTWDMQQINGTDQAGVIQLTTSPRWSGWRYGSAAGLPVMAGATLGITVLATDYVIADAFTLTWNMLVLEIDESASIRGGTP